MASTPFKTLRDFLTTRMRMAHIYQPLMIRTLLTHGGRASIRQIASMFLSKDASQLEYYEEITKNMPGKVSGTPFPSLRNLGKREALARLEQMRAKAPKRRTTRQ